MLGFYNIYDKGSLSFKNVFVSEGALIVKSMNSCGCTKWVLIVPRGYKIYIRYGYYLL